MSIVKCLKVYVCLILLLAMSEICVLGESATTLYTDLVVNMFTFCMNVYLFRNGNYFS